MKKVRLFLLQAGLENRRSISILIDNLLYFVVC